MKNFRKVLALVLVVATLFSFTAMASAVSYEDASKISYKEAVTVLSHIGILNGYKDAAKDEYEFRPANNIERDEMAKMIAVLANAGTDVSSLYASACTFADVPKDNWAASHIAYCAKTGIIAGRSATTFDPNSNITGLETAKMLLVVLGFNAETQGYVGADWKVNVLRDAKVMGLLNNFAADYNVDAKITREEAAQMMLNALEAPCAIGIKNGNSIKLTNALVFTKDDAEMPVSGLATVYTYATLKDALKAGKWALYEGVVITDDILGEKLYGLTRTTTADRDCYYRPATSWKYKTVGGKEKTIGIYAADPFFESYNTTETKVAKALAPYESEATATSKVKFNVYMDGTRQGTANMTTAAEAAAALTRFYGKGFQVEAFYNAAAEEVTLVGIRTFIVQIGQVNTASHTVDVYDFDGDAHTWRNHNFVNDFGLTPADSGKIALAWYCKDSVTGPAYGLHDLKVIEPTVATVTDASTKTGVTKDSSFTADGKAYEYAENCRFWGTTNVVGQPTFTLGQLTSGYLVGKKVDIYTDLNGYVMAVVEHEDNDVLYAVIPNGSVKQYPEYNVQGDPVYSYTTSLVKFETSPAPSEAVPATKSAYDVDWPAKCDTLIQYKLDAKGRVEVTIPDLVNNVYAGEENEPCVLSKFASKTTLPAPIDEKTQILLRVYDYMEGKHVYKYFNGKDMVDATYNLTHAQYFLNPDNAIAYLYAEAETVKATVDTFILGYSKSQIYLKGENQTLPVAYRLYEALVNGEPALVAYNGELTEGDFKVYETNAQYIGKKTLDGEPIYLVVGALEETASGTFSYSNGTVSWTGVNVDLAKEPKIIVAFPEEWDSDNDGVTDLTYTTLKTKDQLTNYIAANGWTNGSAWSFDTNGDGYTDVLYICNTVASDVTPS